MAYIDNKRPLFGVLTLLLMHFCKVFFRSGNFFLEMRTKSDAVGFMEGLLTVKYLQFIQISSVGTDFLVGGRNLYVQGA